jgi:hypothetical protein
MAEMMKRTYANSSFLPSQQVSFSLHVALWRNLLNCGEKFERLPSNFFHLLASIIWMDVAETFTKCP